MLSTSHSLRRLRSACLPLLLFLFGWSSAALAANQLDGHPSPYLAQHAGDPVAWRDWREDVFRDARADNRLVFVSIGYFSCHWCHVMQRESYQDDAVAKLLNEHFISVKIDRELEPDLDQRLVGFVEAIRGSAGWPLNVFLTPQGYPITGFTYLPRDGFADVLDQLQQEWQANHAQLAAAAQRFFEEQMADDGNEAYNAPQIPSAKLVDAFVAQAMLAADEMLGGFGDTSKFPNVPQLGSLLEAVRRDPGLDADVADFVRLTLQAMATRNLADHVNDGFFRYTTDPDWQTPHFEKMLYDNAQLSSLYLRAAQLWPDAGYGALALRTLDFVEDNLKHPDGGYMSSLSAVDRDDREGGAYWWQRAQLAELLGADDFAYVEKLWQLNPASGEFLAGPLIGAFADGEPERNQRIRQKLKLRDATMPADDKRLASWNAMLLEALTRASSFDERFERRAQILYRDLQRLFYRDGELIRFAGNAEVAAAVFEDYAQLARAFDFYGRHFDDTDARQLAARLVERAHARFLRNGRWQPKAQPLIPVAAGKWIMPDLVFYSPMSLWLETALNLRGLDQEVRRDAEQMLTRATREMLDAPYFYGSFILLRAAGDA
ncbi:MAG: DUF255 domain-containing protein [Gammaproteobacteria bacterium]|nr:DUF255 domain-containing protein [Gammaproteobacteria bacterium]